VTVHNGTAANPSSGDNEFMQLQQIKAIIAAVWILAVVAIMVGWGHLTSPGDRLTLGLLAVVPPVAMWFWWNDPVRTMTQNIREARDERPPQR
jgi:hypothetical protein